VRCVKIVYLNPSGGLGGAERCLLDIMAGVRETEAAHELHLVTSADGPLVARAERLGVRVTVLPMPKELVELGDSMMTGVSRGRAILQLTRRGAKAGWATWQYAASLRSTMKRLRPHLIHSNGIKFHLLAGMAQTSAAPLIWHIHDFLSLRPLMARTLRLASARVRGAIAVSQAIQRDGQKVLPCVPVDFVYNAIDTEEFSPRPIPGAWLDHVAGLPEASPGTVRFGLVATYARWKGHEILLKAAAQLLKCRQQPPARFYIIGGPIYQTTGSQVSVDELRAIVTELGIDRCVGFIPFQHTPADAYRALDIVIHASTQPEPFGRTIVEAMACAKPVVVSQGGGAAELFTHDHDAVGVPPNDPMALASALVRLLVDQGKRRSLGDNARQTAIDRFRRHRLGPQILAIYHRVLHASRAA
jgi:glycosyltransferase involved in cell wall biosynthesis